LESGQASCEAPRAGTHKRHPMNNHVRLVRFAYMPTATLGRLYLPNGEILITVERHWEGNKPNVSCIPEGIYQCKPFSGAKYKDVFQVMDVPNRSYILFHAANYPEQLEGCIAPGLALIPYQSSKQGVQNSRAAIERLRAAVPKEGFELEITHFVPEYP
jgi:hypothetical protein